jgi:3-dehydroquinate synthetase
MTAPVRSSEPAVVHVALGARGYDVVIGRGALVGLGERIATLRSGASAAIVTDSTVASHHLAAAQAALERAGVRSTRLVVPAGESSKNWSALEQICEGLIAARIERADVVVALGGGVIGDLAGLAAALVRRGLEVVQVPTTLLAQVDSALGGKTAINSRHGKNLIGVFHQPSLVVADTALLDTLPVRAFRAGYAEVVKCGLINDAAFFAWLEANWRDVFASTPAREHAITKSCRAKAASGPSSISDTPLGTRSRPPPAFPIACSTARRSPSGSRSRSRSPLASGCCRKARPSGSSGTLRRRACRRIRRRSRAACRELTGCSSS